MNGPFLLRITGPVIATSLLLLALGAGAAWHVHRLQKSVTEELRSNISGVRAAEELEILVREARTQLDYFLITGDRKYLRAVSGSQGDINQWLAETERWSLTPQEQALTSRARSGYQRFVMELSVLGENNPPGSLEKKIRDLIDNVLIREIQQPAHEFLDLNEQEVEESMASNQVFAGRLVFALLLLGICGSGAGLVAGIGLARSFNRRLVQLSVPIRDAAGRLDEVVGPITFAAGADLHELECVLRQIAERVGAIIDRLRESERQVLQAEQLAAVGQMAAGMAHELGNPLTSMKILVQAALACDERVPDAKSGRLCSCTRPCLGGRDLLVIEEEITRLERLVQSFLLFGRPPQVEKKTLDVGPLVEQTLGLVAARSAAAETMIEFHLPHEAILATVDPGQFRQVLLNLLLNALDAAGPGGAILMGLENGPDRWLTLRVADNGAGLPPTLGNRIFAPFVTTKETGLGLGLSICKRVAEAHGGTLTGANRPEGGAEFTLRLPPADVGGQKSEVRSQRSEIGDRRSEIEGQKSEVGSRRSEIGDRKD
jgi:two-component system sensor histidine kinase HydH